MNDMYEQFNITQEEADSKLALGDAVMRLRKNKDFKLVFEDNLFHRELNKLAKAVANPELISNPQLREIYEVQLTAIGVVINALDRFEDEREAILEAMENYEEE